MLLDRLAFSPREQLDHAEWVLDPGRPDACSRPTTRRSVSMTATMALLLSEDDPVLRDVLEAALMDAGFTIVAAGDGTKALAELEADAARFRAVITDIKLGTGPDGWKVSRRARELVSEMPIIYISGDSAQDWPSKGVPNSLMIAKPFPPVQLITAVSTLITDADTRRTD